MLEHLQRFIGQELNDNLRLQIESIWTGLIKEQGLDAIPIEDHDESRLNIYVDRERKITSFKTG